MWQLAWVNYFLTQSLKWTWASCRRGSQRRVSIYKTKKKVDTTKDLDSLPNFTFSEEAKWVLQDLFTQYPPDTGEVDNRVVRKQAEKFNKARQRKDDIFCKPSMSKAEIAKKVESLSSKKEMVAHLKKVFPTWKLRIFMNIVG